MSQKPTIVFVPGAWHHADTWKKVSTILEAQEYKCVRMTLPSTLGSPDTTFSEDIQSVRDVIKAETTEGRDVVVAVHSYGGAVGESALKGFTKPKANDPSPDNSSGHVIGLIIMASGFLPTGACFTDGFEEPPPIWKFNRETGFCDITVEPRELFYHDLPEDEGKYWVGRLLKQSLKALETDREHGYAGWKEVPVVYLATKEDKALPYQAQLMFVQMAKDDGADVTLRELETSHSPMLSKPQETADIVAEAVAAFLA
ncbi:Fc.00g043340.m01.CDS01 [Cosmosporella sp. VM-42]